MNKVLTMLALSAMLVSAGGHSLAAQQRATSSKPANGKVIPVQQARSIAAAKVPNKSGLIQEKLKTDNGVMVYEFDIETPGPGHQEVMVDAVTGIVLRSAHEDDIVGQVFHTHGVTDTGADMDSRNTAARPPDRVFTATEVSAIRPLISEQRALQIAQHQLPGAPVKDVDLETKQGVLIWDVDLDTPGPGHLEVLIDATSGMVVRQKHK